MADPSDRVPYKPDTTPEQEIASHPQASKVFSGRVSYMDDVNYHRMANYFDISYDDRRDLRVAEKLSYLTDWAISHGAKDEIDAMSILKNTTHELGLSIKGQDLIKKLYEFARLDTQKERINKEIELYKTIPEDKGNKESIEDKVDTKSIKRIVQKEIESVSKSLKTTLKSHITRNIKKLEQPLSNVPESQSFQPQTI